MGLKPHAPSEMQKQGQRRRVEGIVPHPSPDQAGSGWGTPAFGLREGEQATATAKSRSQRDDK